MRLLLALRLFKDWHAKCAVEAVSKAGVQRGRLVSLHAERQHPALRNIADYLRDVGKLPVVRRGEVLSKSRGEKVVENEADCRIYWCEVETDVPVADWENRLEVEALILKSDFEDLVEGIRYRSGVAYFKACEDFADKVKTHSSNTIRYLPPKMSETRAA